MTGRKLTGKVLIVGAGIAGPALAIALRRAGIDCAVYESSPVPRDAAGVFLNLAPNGLNVLRELGLGARIDGLGFLNDRLVFRNDAGRTLAEVPVGGVTLLRGELSRMLREAAMEAGVPFQLGKRLESVEEREGQVAARFADGSTATGSLIVGADGIHSRVRSEVLPAAPAPEYTGVINLGGVVATDLPSTGRSMHMIFGRRGFFGYAVRPSGDTYWFSNFARREEPARGELDDVNSADFRQRLLDLHRDDPPEVTRILGAVTSSMGAFAIYDITSLPRWHSGRACLIGDAAHAVGPHVGQGASLALEDVFVLAKCLRDLGVSDPQPALRTFEALRRERVEAIVKYSRRTGAKKAPASAFGRKLRDLVLPIFLRKGAQDAGQLYSYPIDWDERIGRAA